MMTELMTESREEKIDRLLSLLKIGYNIGDGMMGLPAKEIIMKTTESELERVHPYSISKASDGRYVTYVILDTGERRQLRKKNKEDLYACLLEHYGLTDYVHKHCMPLSELYAEWVNYKKRYINVSNKKKGLSPSTIRRYERDYTKYLEGQKYMSIPICNVTTIALETFLFDVIGQSALVEKTAKNLIGYFVQCFEYARRAGYLDQDPSELMDKQLLLSTCRFDPPKPDAERVLSVSELYALRQSVLKHEKDYPHYIADYAIELSIMTGMRVGEISALRWDCIDDEYINIRYSEHRLDYTDRPSELVIGEPKNGKHRKVPLTADMRQLFMRIKALNHPNGNEFVFTTAQGTRCTGHDIGCAITRRGGEAGIKKVSVHCVRRTVSSILRTELPIKAVANMLGHLERTNEEFYNYDFSEDDAKKNALNSLSKVVQFPLISGEKQAKYSV